MSAQRTPRQLPRQVVGQLSNSDVLPDGAGNTFRGACQVATQALRGGDVALATAMLGAAETSLARRADPGPMDVPLLGLIRARLLLLRGQAFVARSHLSETLQVLREISDEEEQQRMLVQALVDTTRAECACGDYYRARTLAAEALALARVALGADDPDTAEAWAALGIASCCLGELSTARGSLRLAQEILRTLGPRPGPQEAELEHQLAVLERARGNPQEAVSHVRRALSLREQPDCRRCDDLILLACVLAELGATDEADEALADADASTGGRDPANPLQAVGLLSAKAVVVLHGGDLAGASEEYRLACSAATDLLGKDDPHVGALLATRSRIEMDRGHRQIAVALANQAVAVLAPQSDMASPTLNLARQVLVDSTRDTPGLL
jgi:tetratricopeptide (TPR) repeat protein